MEDIYQGWIDIDIPGRHTEGPSRCTIYGKPEDNPIRAKETASVMALEYFSDLDTTTKVQTNSKTTEEKNKKKQL